MNWFEKQAVKLVVWRIKRVKAVGAFIRRWGPLVSVLGLAGKTYLEGAGKVDAANALDFVLKLLQVTVTDPAMAMSVVGGAGASYKLGKIVADAYRAGFEA